MEFFNNQKSSQQQQLLLLNATMHAAQKNSKNLK